MSTTTGRRILVTNAGSTTLKHAVLVVEPDGGLHVEQKPITSALPANGVGEAAEELVATLSPDAVGHRVVHGGEHHTKPERVSLHLVASLRNLVELAPLHLPATIDQMVHLLAVAPELPQVACFDTAFHALMPERVRRFALDARWYDAGIRRFGFHGLACESVVEQLAPHVPARLVIAHLGGGASLTAVDRGISVRTTMGLTPTGGLPGATRSGDLDPGVVLALVRALDGDLDAVERELDRTAGLLGLSGLSGDVATLEELRAAGSTAALLALNVFAEEVARGIAAHAVTLRGLDCLVFSGGIGEHDERFRTDVMARLDGLTDQCEVRVVSVHEEQIIARATAALL